MIEANVPPIYNLDKVEVEQNTTQISVLSDEERNKDKRTTEEIVSDVIVFILDGESNVDNYEEQETINSPNKRIIVNSQEFYDELRGLLTSSELNQIFITDSQGELLYPAGVKVIFDIEYSDENRTNPKAVELLIEHSPLEVVGQADGAGGVVYSVPVEGDPSMRKIMVNVNLSEPNRISMWSFGTEGGYEIRGGTTLEDELILNGQRREKIKETSSQGLQPLDSLGDTSDFFVIQTLMDNLQEWLEENQLEESS